jgi:hypothetical protein
MVESGKWMRGTGNRGLVSKQSVLLPRPACSPRPSCPSPLPALADYDPVPHFPKPLSIFYFPLSHSPPRVPGTRVNLPAASVTGIRTTRCASPMHPFADRKDETPPSGGWASCPGLTGASLASSNGLFSVWILRLNRSITVIHAPLAYPVIHHPFSTFLFLPLTPCGESPIL